MIEDRGTRKPIDAWPRCREQVARSLRGVAMALLAGCGVSIAAEPPEVSQQATQEPRLAGLISSSSDLFTQPQTGPAEPIAVLLPPQSIESAPRLPAPPVETRIAQTPPDSTAADIVSEPVTPAIGGLPEQERLFVEQVIRDCSEAAPGVLTNTQVNEQAATNIRQANALANRGAHYAARRKLIEALRMVSQVKDAQQRSRQFSTALAAGLRALDEAEDFAPRGTQLEGELELGLIAAAHRTPIARQSALGQMLPQQMMDRYFRYAQLKLAKSVADEPVGSMALYALGKVTSQMGRMEPQRHRLAHRRAVAFQQAALMSHGQNHMAAHELAVLLAESGQFAAAQELLLKVSTHQPNATVYANLARVQQRLGLTEQANIGHALAVQLARQGAGGASPIRWIAPEDFIRTGGGPVQVTPTPGNGKLPMTRRPRYDQRTAQAPSSPAPSQAAAQPTGSTTPPNWR